ncbi:MAG: hypothetical protein P8049_01130 [Gemmatimonadota bacterium]
MSRRATATLLTAVLALAACGGGDGGTATSEWTGTAVDSAGILLVTNTSTPVWNEGDAWTLEEVLTIGAAEGEPEYQFGQISGIGITSDGRIVVSDMQGQHVKVFAADGTYERTFGEAGSGPGQFGQQAGPVLVGRGDTILVPDIQNQRVARMTADGDDLGTFRVGFEAGVPIRWEMRADGALVTQLRKLNLPNTPGEPDTLDAIVSRGYDGVIADTIFMVPAGKTFSFAGGQPEFHFFSPEPIWALLPDGGIVLGTNDEYRFVFYGPDGAPTRIVSIPSEPDMVTEEDREIFVSTLESLWGQAGVPPQGIEQLKSGISFEDRFPAFTQALIGPDGTLWVQKIRALSEMSAEEKESFNPLQNIGSAEWDVFDSGGRYLGIVEMPFHYQPLGFDGDRVLGVWRDDLDVQYAKILRVVGPS